MRYITPDDRNQLQANIVCLDDLIEDNNMVRVIDFFVDNLDLVFHGFTKSKPKRKGRKPYNPKDMLKLYLYGYLNKIDSSRKLEAESKRNIEVKWLLGNLTPDFKTIADFRKDNRDKLKEVFKEFTFILKNAKLLDFELTAIDGSLFSAVNHNAKNYSKSKLKKLMDKLDKQIDSYLNSLSSMDNTEFNRKIDLSEKLSKLKEEQRKYQFLLERMKETGESQISLTDPDSKMMHKPKSKTDVSYNVQTAVDSKHKLISEFEVTNDCNDAKQLSNISGKVMETHNLDSLRVVADSGYFSGEELAKSQEMNVETFVSEKKNDRSDRKGIFSSRHFKYDKENDVYICPLGKELPYSSTDKKYGSRVYGNTGVCRGCENLVNCASKSSSCRRIYRSQYADIVEKQKIINKKNRDIIESRKMIVEHPFGTIKSAMGIDRFLTKGLESVNGEFSIIALAFNFKRAFNILGFNGLMEAIQSYYSAQKQDKSLIISFFLKIMHFFRFLEKIKASKVILKILPMKAELNFSHRLFAGLRGQYVFHPTQNFF